MYKNTRVLREAEKNLLDHSIVAAVNHNNIIRTVTTWKIQKEPNLI